MIGLGLGLGLTAVRGGAAPYTANPVNFDGTNDYLTRGAGFTNAEDSKLFTFSFWFRPTAGDAARQITCAESSSVGVHTRFDANERWVISARIAGSSTVNALTIATSKIFSLNIWYHVIISVDMANVANRAVYIDGVVDNTTWTTYSNELIDFTHTNFAVGAVPNGSGKFAGDMADFWYAPGQYIDLSVQANREKFILDGAPVDLGADGSTPTGVAPILFLSGATDAWHTNKGTGGGLTEQGALTDGTGPVEVP